MAELEGALRGGRARRVFLGGRMSQAAVAAICRSGDLGVELLVIERARRAGDPWSGNLAFPGGKRSASDLSLVQTAVRETLEETGLDLARDATPLGPLSQVLATTHSRRRPMMIQPFVFRLDTPAPLRLNHEVAQIHWLPLHELRAPERHLRIRRRVLGLTLPFPAIAVGERNIWGLTHQMLRDLLGRLPPT